MIQFRAISDEEEGKRIHLIGTSVMRDKLAVGFVVEDEAKADRYIAKLKQQFPGIRVTYKGPGPVSDTILVKLATPVN